MARNYTKLQEVADIALERKAAGETNRGIAESSELMLKQVKQLITRDNLQKAKLHSGIPLRPKGHPRAYGQNEEVMRSNEVFQLQMTVKLLHKFLRPLEGSSSEVSCDRTFPRQMQRGSNE